DDARESCAIAAEVVSGLHENSPCRKTPRTTYSGLRTSLFCGLLCAALLLLPYHSMCYLRSPPGKPVRHYRLRAEKNRGDSQQIPPERLTSLLLLAREAVTHLARGGASRATSRQHRRLQLFRIDACKIRLRGIEIHRYVPTRAARSALRPNLVEALLVQRDQSFLRRLEPRARSRRRLDHDGTVTLG